MGTIEQLRARYRKGLKPAVPDVDPLPDVPIPATTPREIDRLLTSAGDAAARYLLSRSTKAMPPADQARVYRDLLADLLGGVVVKPKGTGQLYNLDARIETSAGMEDGLRNAQRFWDREYQGRTGHEPPPGLWSKLIGLLILRAYLDRRGHASTDIIPLIDVSVNRPRPGISVYRRHITCRLLPGIAMPLVKQLAEDRRLRDRGVVLPDDEPPPF